MAVHFTLPTTRPAHVESAPAAIIMIGGKRFDCFRVTDAEHGEAPVIPVSSRCAACARHASADIAACVAPSCPSRAQDAA